MTCYINTICNWTSNKGRGWKFFLKGKNGGWYAGKGSNVVGKRDRVITQRRFSPLNTSKMKLHCKGERYRSISKQDLKVHTASQIDILFLLYRDTSKFIHPSVKIWWLEICHPGILMYFRPTSLISPQIFGRWVKYARDGNKVSSQEGNIGVKLH